VPSKPGYEPSSQARPSRHPEVARVPLGALGYPPRSLGLACDRDSARHGLPGLLPPDEHVDNSIPRAGIGAGAYGPST
jgi:hypothetical protein